MLHAEFAVNNCLCTKNAIYVSNLVNSHVVNWDIQQMKKFILIACNYYDDNSIVTSKFYLKTQSFQIGWDFNHSIKSWYNLLLLILSMPISRFVDDFTVLV